MELKGKRALIFGVGRSGLSAARACASRGARVTLTDKREEPALGVYVNEARAAGFALALGGHPEALLEGADLIVLSPGVPGSIAPLKAARAKGLPILSEIELAFTMAPRRWLAVTGTNGKTTTTSLLGAMVERGGLPHLVGGNIGRGLADEVERLAPGGIVVAEVSSFQLEEIREFRPEAAVITNLTPDHLDRYPSMAAYAAAKARIFENQGPAEFLILNALDQGLLDLCSPARATRLLFNRLGAVGQGAWIEAGRIWLRLPGEAALDLMPLSALRLRGPHNHENALAAALAARAAGVDPEAIARTLRDFAGVEHRLEFCGEVNGLRFVNDSKATNVDSVEKALQSFEEPVHLILGGRDKEGDFKRLEPLIRSKVARLYFVGEAADKIAGQVGHLKESSRVASLEAAVEEGLRRGKKGEWMLLSPGCASFDMFQNYEHRGRVFKAAVAGHMKAEAK